MRPSGGSVGSESNCIECTRSSCQCGEKDRWIVIAVMIIIALIIFVYFKYHKQGKMFFDTILYKTDAPRDNITFWKISHFLFYMILGYFFPEEWWVAIAIGVFWEVFELVAGRCTGDKWWHGTASDIVVNIFGFATGVVFASIAPCS